MFLVAVFQLDPIVRWLWPIPVAMFFVYPYLKRFTWLSHVWLGACLGLAPVGAWLAVSGTAPWEAWAIGGAVLLWVAGFDLFYSSSTSSTTGRGLHSGRCASESVGSSSAPGLFHALTVVCLRPQGRAGVGVLLARRRRVAALLGYEHSLVRPGDLRRLDAAFFTVNGVISLVFFAFVALDVLVALIRARGLEKRYGRRRALAPRRRRPRTGRRPRLRHRPERSGPARRRSSVCSSVSRRLRAVPST